ncbi:DUF4157 domain-containing protein [Flavobacterium sp. DGU11]|uniref:DUF4157 domain-containing protein n=1 Tax=Flavobacterium arundinis TaxID=3139143 RepID=A0ABU9HTB3_9FLAO
MKDRKNYPETSGTEQKAVRQASVGAVLEGYRNSLQRKTKDEGVPLQKKENNTGLPDNLKSGIENLSGHSLDDVKVHYNSAKPAQLQAHAYAQGTNIHIGPGQEKHLPHEAWHVVQQKQGRVRPTMQMKGINVNDDKTLEQEADVMGERAVNLQAGNTIQRLLKNNVSGTQNIQRMISVNGKEYNSQQQITDVMRDIETSCKLSKGDMGRFGKVIRELLQPEVMESFTSYRELYNYLNPVLRLKESVFLQDRFLNDEDALSIIYTEPWEPMNCHNY